MESLEESESFLFLLHHHTCSLLFVLDLEDVTNTFDDLKKSTEVTELTVKECISNEGAVIKERGDLEVELENLNLKEQEMKLKIEDQTDLQSLKSLTDLLKNDKSLLEDQIKKQTESLEKVSEGVEEMDEEIKSLREVASTLAGKLYSFLKPQILLFMNFSPLSYVEGNKALEGSIESTGDFSRKASKGFIDL